MDRNDSYCTFQNFIETSEFLIGKYDSDSYIEGLNELINHKQFYFTDCKVPFIVNRFHILEGTCRLTNASKNFKPESLWATFHPEWTKNFGVIVIRRGLREIHFTTDKREALFILNEQNPNFIATTDCVQNYINEMI